MDWPRIEFHEVCGSNIRLSEDRSQAVKISSYFDGLCFTSRPLLPREGLILSISGKGWTRGIRLGVTDTDPRLLEQDLPDFLRPGLYKDIWGGALVSRANVTDPDGIHDFSVHFESAHGKLMVGFDDSVPVELVTGVRTNKPVYLVFDLALHNVKIGFEAYVPLDSLTAVTVPEPVAPLTSRTHKNSWLSPAYFTYAGETPLTVRPYFVMDRDPTPSVGNFAFVDTALKPGSTLIVELIEMKKTGPVCIVLTTGSAEDVFSWGCLHQLCDHTYSLMMNSGDAEAGDELAVRISQKGAVSVSLNNRRWKKRMHVDANLEYRVAFCMSNISVLSMVGVTHKAERTDRSAAVRSSPGELVLSECVICLDNARSVAAIPCFHVVMCGSCAHSLRRSRAPLCPLCRAKITEVRKIYLS